MCSNDFPSSFLDEVVLHQFPAMDRRRLMEAVVKGDVLGLCSLMEEDENIIKQTVPESLNTVLHLAARYGHEELASEIIKSCPEMVSSENGELETPLHEACKEGHLGIIKLLLEIDNSIVYKKNLHEQSPLFVACERGQINAVKHLLNFPRLFLLEVDMFTSSLHAAASSGHTEIVKEILRARPDFARKKDIHGCTPLHVACSKGHLDITREILKPDSDLSSVQDSEGRTPLHYAAIKGRINIIDEILSANIGSAEIITFNGETILHLAVKNNHSEVVRFLLENFNISKLLNLHDSDGNTVLHLATAGKLTGMVVYLLKFGMEVNFLNHKGYTALDVVEADASNSGALAIVPALKAAGAKRCDELSYRPLDDRQIAKSTSKRSSDQNVARMNSWTNKNLEASHSSRLPRHHRQNRQRKKQLDLHTESLRNARNTITIVAVLIATVTFAAGINPPGGFDEESGYAILGKKTSFKVFLVCNIVALFLSIGIVNVLVSIIPFKRKSMMKLLTITHKIMWISTLFMASAFIAAVWAIMPKGKGKRFVEVELVVIGGGCTMIVFCGLGIMLARQWHKKHKWRKEKAKRAKDGSPKSNISHVEELKIIGRGYETSTNSDLGSSDYGYHLY